MGVYLFGLRFQTLPLKMFNSDTCVDLNQSIKLNLTYTYVMGRVFV